MHISVCRTLGRTAKHERPRAHAPTQRTTCICTYLHFTSTASKGTLQAPSPVLGVLHLAMLTPKHLVHLNHGYGRRIFGRPAALPLRNITTYAMISEGAPSAGRVVTDSAEIAKLAASFRRVAVLGIKTERQVDQPAFYVAEYLASAGVEVRCGASTLSARAPWACLWVGTLGTR